MKKMSIKAKLILLCASLLGLVLIVGGVGAIANKNVSKDLHYVKTVQVPSVRAMGLADMIHDGLRAVVLRAIMESESKDETAKKEVADELVEMTGIIKKQMEILSQLQLKPEARKVILETEPDLNVYIKDASEITTLALAGKKNQALVRMPNFQKSFSTLEARLGDIGDGLTNEADAASIESKKKEALINFIGITITIVGVLLGIFISFLLVCNLMQALTRTINELTASNHQLASAASQTSSLATELSQSTTEQAASIQETMASIEQISAMVNQNASSATKAKDAVDANKIASDEGVNSIHEMLQAMTDIKHTNDGIANQMEESNRRFKEIVSIISAIGKKTNVINDIVFQTKLLSFNASVEAARAGEYGKGFSIVADEVGNLARMSGNAAKEISDLLASSISKVNGIVSETSGRVCELVQVGKQKVELGEQTAQKCNQALEKITKNATSVAVMVTAITSASKEQAQGIKEVTKAITSMDQVIRMNSQAAQTSSTQAELMNSEAQKLGATIYILAEFVRGENKAG